MICLLLTRITSKIKIEAKDRDIVTTNPLANTTLGQSERAYYRKLAHAKVGFA